MAGPSEIDRAAWEARYAAARAALLDVERLLALRARLAAGGAGTRAPVALLDGGDALGQAPAVGVLAGSFNPLSAAHVGLARAARAAIAPGALVWALSRVTVDKERVERASLLDRAAQLASYIESGRPETAGDALAVMDAGLYADQAAAFRALLPPTAALWLVVGFDKAVQIFDPRYYDDREAALRRLFAAAGLLVAPRDAHTQGALAALLDDPANRPYAAHVRYIGLPAALARVSSTALREAAGGPHAPPGAGDGGQSDSTDLSLPSPAAVGEGPGVRAGDGSAAPEGAALAEVTGAYRPPVAGPDGEVIDAYWIRQAWLAALAAIPAARRPPVDLAHLIELTSRADATGAGARRWLNGEHPPGAPADAATMIARLA